MIDVRLADGEILVLRDVRPDMTSRGGFKWPESGQVEAPDWRDDDVCGGGLHGLPWGVGGDYRIGGCDAKWLVVKAKTENGNYRHGSGEMTDKCKFKAGEVVFCGSREDAVALIAAHAPAGSRINWSTQTAGDGSTQTAGYRSTQTAGDECYMKSGKDTVQVSRWWADGMWHTALRLVTEAEADKWYFVQSGEWRECTAEEVARLDAPEAGEQDGSND